MLNIYDNYVPNDDKYYNLYDYLYESISLSIPDEYYDKVDTFTLLIDYIHICNRNDLKLQAAYFKQILNALVYELYLQEEFTKHDREIFRYLELKNINKVESSIRFDIVKNEFDRLYDTKHEVRNHVELYEHITKVREFEFKYRK